MTFVLLTVEAVDALHAAVLNPGEIPGRARDKSLDGALARVDNRIAYGMVADAFDLAAAYAVAIAQATRESRAISLGAGTRGAISLVRIGKAFAALEDRGYVIPDDIKRAALPVLRHRVQLTPEVAISGQEVDEVLRGIIDSVPAPRGNETNA